MGMHTFGGTMIINRGLRHALLPPDVAGCRAGSWRFRPATLSSSTPEISSTLGDDFDAAPRVRTSADDLGKERHNGLHFLRETEGRVHHEKTAGGKRLRPPPDNR